MSNIYNIQQNLLSIFEQIEENEGELTPELELALQINQANFKNKVRDYTKVIQQFEIDIKAIKEEKDRLNSLQKSKENTINSLKQILIVAIKNFGDTNKSGVKYVDWGTGKCSIRKSTSIDIDTDRVNTFIHKVISYFDWLKYTNTEGQQEINIDDIVDYANKGNLDSDTKFTKDDLLSLSTSLDFDINLKDILTTDKGRKVIDAILNYTSLVTTKANIDKNALNKSEHLPNYANKVNKDNINIK